MPHRLEVFSTPQFIESMVLLIGNTCYILISATILPWITFVFTMLIVISRLKMFIQKNHDGSIKKWFKWLVKKN